MGAGKSTIGKYLAGELKLTFYDTDRVIEERAGVPVSWIFDIEGEDGFQKREEKILEELSSKEGIVLATGGNIVLSKKNRNLLSSRGKVIYLKLNLSTQFERTKQDSRRPQLEEKNKLIMTLEKLQEELNPLYSEIADYVFETNEYSAKNIAKTIVDALD